MNGVSEVLAGAIGGTACVIVGQPFDTIKTKVQTLPHVYTSVLVGVRKTFEEGGLRGYYAGSTPAIITATAENAVLFLAYNRSIDLVRKTFGVQNDHNLRPWHHGCAGSVSAVFTTLVVCPTEIVKCRQQVQSTGLWHVVRSLYGQDGPRGFFRGLTATLNRDIPGYFVFFSSKFAIENALRQSNLPLSETATTLISGGATGCCLWAAVFPFDVLKSRIQVQVSPYSPLLKMLLHILASEGPRALYRGITPALVRSFPANAALWLAYDNSKRYLDGLFRLH